MYGWSGDDVENQIEGLQDADNRLADALAALEDLPSQKSSKGREARIPDACAEIRMLRDVRSRIREMHEIYEGGHGAD